MAPCERWNISISIVGTDASLNYIDNSRQIFRLLYRHPDVWACDNSVIWDRGKPRVGSSRFSSPVSCVLELRTSGKTMQILATKEKNERLAGARVIIGRVKKCLRLFLSGPLTVKACERTDIYEILIFKLMFAYRFGYRFNLIWPFFLSSSQLVSHIASRAWILSQSWTFYIADT